MRHENSVFHSLLKAVPWGVFDRAVAACEADKGVRRLSSRTQFTALLYGQLAGTASLRALVESFGSHARRLYHLGVRPVARSSLAEANAQRPEAVFSAVFAALVARAQPKLARQMGECVRLIDATTVRLSRLSESWARFSADVCGAKAHVIYDPDADCPTYVAVTPQRINDITAAKAMPLQPGATYVFDLGYYDFGWWAALNAAGCRIVTRLKSNTPLTVATERLMPAGGMVTSTATILSDRTGYLPSRLAQYRRNPMQARVREVCVRTDTGKVLRLLTNDLTAPAATIAAFYKRRWAIELFFRWIKQTLKITHFIGRSENAVCIQIAVALIAYLLLRIVQTAHGLTCGMLTFARLVRSNLMHRKTPRQLLDPAILYPPKQQHHQHSLAWT